MARGAGRARRHAPRRVLSRRAAGGRPLPGGIARATRLTIRRAALDVIRRHADDDLPNECCGLLIGRAGMVERAAPARNLRASPDRYLVDPADHCAAIRSARAGGFEVVGVYHSHPTGSLRPSAVDRREASYREFVYLIVSRARARRRRRRPGGVPPGRRRFPGNHRGDRRLGGLVERQSEPQATTRRFSRNDRSGRRAVRRRCAPTRPCRRVSSG